MQVLSPNARASVAMLVIVGKSDRSGRHVHHRPGIGADRGDPMATASSRDRAGSGEHKPIPGVTLVIDGTTIGAVSGADGRFAIVGAPAGHRHLVD